MAIQHHLVLLLFSFLSVGLHGQMVHGSDTLAGNEWIRTGTPYYKFSVDQDGIYRIPYGTLQASGIDADAVGTSFRLFSLGQQVPVFVSTEGLFGPDDYIEFYGYKNRGEMDRHLFLRPDQDMLNPQHSMYTDERPYYLVLTHEVPQERVTIVPNAIQQPPPAETTYRHTTTHHFTAALNDPYYNVSGGGAVSYSSYMHAEGFCKTNEPHSTTNITTSARPVSGADAQLRIRFASTNYGSHRWHVTWNDQTIDNIELADLQIKEITYTLSAQELLDNNQLKLTALTPQSRHSLVEIDLTYDRLFDAGGSAEMLLELSPGGLTKYVVLDGFDHQDVAPVIYTTDGQRRMIAAITGAQQVQFLWPENPEGIHFHLVNAATLIREIGTLEKTEFDDLEHDDTEYIIITHPDILASGTESSYVQYRSSPEGGMYKAKAYSILDLYDQFGYGIEKHPQAIRNFVEFAHRHWPSAKMIFIIGRGIEYNRSRYPGSWEPGFFVPTFGRPGADNLLAATVWDLMPRYPIARLAVTDAAAVDIYLNKVKEHDLARYTGQTLNEKKWIKNVMHIGGGKTTNEQESFKNVLASLGAELVNSDYGGQLSFFQKTSTDPVGQSQSAELLALLNEGCGIINYLGHSATSTFEFNINDPSEWNNKGRYPVFSAMGCSAGQIHGTILSLSDNYVQIADEGAIAFISGSGSQFANALASWARPWYQSFGELDYGTTLGESVLHGLKALQTLVDPETTTSNAHRFLLEQQTFQGDPALLLHPFPGPDYLVDRQSVSIQPEMLNTKLDSFDLTFSIHNIGRNLRQLVPYIISIRTPDGSMLSLLDGIAPTTGFETPVTVRLPLATGSQSGTFRLLIHLDPANMLEELPAPDAELNNTLLDNLGVEGIEIFIVDNLITATYPPDFSIVNTESPVLIATGSNAFSGQQDIVFEIDTTALFNSPFLVRESFADAYPTHKWSPPVLWTPGQVYYWRVSTDSIAPEQSYIWSGRSFVYMPASAAGWNQSHFHQYTANTTEQLLTDSTGHTFHFDGQAKNFKILNRYHNIDQGLFPNVVLDGVILAEFFTGFRNRNVQLFVVTFDSLTGDFLLNPNPGLHGSANHLSFDARVFPYRADLPESRQALIQFVENEIPAGDYVFFYTYQQPMFPDYFPEQWAADEAEFGQSLFTMIESQFPATAVRNLASIGSVPYILFFQKDRGGIAELIAADTTEVISYNVDIKSSLTRGKHLSTLVGPASKWHAIQWETTDTLNDTTGVSIVSAYAISSDFSDTLTLSTHLTTPDTVIAGLDATAYPYIQLIYDTQDSVTYDPGDLLYWRVLYDGYPELVIRPDIGFTFIADTLFQGETMYLHTYAENVSPYEVDTLPVSLRIISASNETRELTTQIDGLPGGEQAPVTFEYNTKDLTGDHQVVMEINAGRIIPELNYNNNIGILPMHVLRDQLNPVLDVTFDGYKIQDGDLVSARPVILIRLRDDNLFARLTDTSAFEIHLTYPSDLQPRRVSFQDAGVVFAPAPPLGINQASVTLQPYLFEDGIYTLQVHAIDASGNPAGDNRYEITFKVIQDAAVSYIYNFPNPFRTTTRFTYTLTGEGAPDEYSIQIVALTGQVVREITADDLGPLVPGTHGTQYEWDGTDNNGNPLPSGMYLYRLHTRDEMQSPLPHYPTHADELVSPKGWGKLVLIR